MKTYIDYYAAVHWMNNSLILMNNIHEIDPNFEEPINEDEEGNPREYFQYFLTSMSDNDTKFMRKFFPKVRLAKSNVLDCWVLCVDHYGTSWDYVWTECREIMMPNKWNEKNRGTIKIDRSYVAHYMKTE